MGTLDGKEVVVTGGRGELGAAVVELLTARGARVHAPARSELSLDDEAAVTAYYAALPALWASIDVAAAFAMAKIADTSLADLDAQWRTNSVTCFLACREAVRAIRRGNGGGRIVNVGRGRRCSRWPG